MSFPPPFDRIAKTLRQGWDGPIPTEPGWDDSKTIEWQKHIVQVAQDHLEDPIINAIQESIKSRHL